MRSEKEMMDLILGTAEEDARIRAVIMNGSRVNPNINKDIFQDYDIVYVVRNMESFTSDHSWVDRFGERIIMQMPEDMHLIPPDGDGHFTYLMQFADGNRIDLTLIPFEKHKELIERDSLSRLLLDKDGIIDPFPPSSDADYLIKKPSQKEFSNACNEFWWVSTYVAKGLWRDEIPYAKHMLEVPVRDMLIIMLKWYVGIKTDFSISVGKAGKYLKKYLEPGLWNKFIATYPDAHIENIWKSHFIMCALFRETAISVANHFGYEYLYEDDERVSAHLRHVRELPKGAEEIY